MRGALLMTAWLLAGCDGGKGEPAPTPKPQPASTADPEPVAEPEPEPEPAAKAGVPEEIAVEGAQLEAAKAAADAPKPIDPVPGPSATLVTIEAATPAASGGRLTENVGVEAMPGKLVPTLRAGCELPCWSAALVWPDGQDTTVDVDLFRSRGLDTRKATKLGTFRVSEVPPGKDKRSKVIVALGVDGGALKAHAVHRETGHALPITRVR